MTDTQLNDPVSRGVAPKTNRRWWKFLLIFLAIPIGATALTLGVWGLTLAQDSKRQVFHIVDSGNFVPPQLADQPNQPRAASQLAQPFPNSWSTEPLTTAPPIQYPNTSALQKYGPNNANPRQVIRQQLPVQSIDPITGQVTTTYRGVTPIDTSPTPAWNSILPAIQQQNVHNHDRRVLELVGELRSLQGNNTDETLVEPKLAELRRMLEEEFSQMHQRQSDEIDAATKRLDALRNIHDERGRNQSQIVQRRIDQLIGKSNPLDWEMNPYPTTVPGNNFVPHSPVVGPQIPGLPNPSLPNPYQLNPSQPDLGPPMPNQASGSIPGGYPGASGGYPGAYRQPNGFVPSPSPTPPSFLPPSDNSVNQRIIEQMPLSYDRSVLKSDASLSTRPNLPSNSLNSSAESSLNRLNDVFAVISSAGEANLSVQAKKRILDTNTKLHNQGQVERDVMQKAKDEFESATQKSRVLKAQLNAMQRTLNLEADAAKDRLLAATKSLDSANGTEAEKTVARSEMSKAQAASDAANELLSQFEEAVKLLNNHTNAEPDPTTPVQQTPASDSTPPKLEAQDDPNNSPT